MRVKVCIVTLVLVGFSCLCFADTLIVPFSSYPKDVRESFRKEGLKLDLDSNDRTKDSWGFLNNKGTNYELVSYYPIPETELPLIQQIIFSQVNNE